MRRVVAIAALAGAACTEQAPPEAVRPRKVDPAYVRDNLLDAAPPGLGEPLATFGGGKVRYLGNEMDARTAAPGEKVTITHYWEVVEPPGPGWKLFTHVRGGAGEFVNADGSEMRTGHPVGAWKAGQVIRDEQHVVLDADWRSPTATVVVGFYQPGKHRIADRMEVTGARVADRAAQVTELAVDLSKAPPPPGTLVLARATGPITIDGRADEPAWRGAAQQTSFAGAEGCELKDRTSAKLTWDDEHLYLFVSAEDPDVFSPFTAHDDHLWEHDVVEIFIDADRNRRGYVELQVNPRNVHFDTWFAGNRPKRDDSYTAGMQTAVAVRGTVDDRDDNDAGWDVELAIPLEAVRGKDPAMKVDLPPRDGDEWRLNVVRADKNREGRVRAASWNRIGCEDFHALDRMLTVRFSAPEPPPAHGTIDDDVPPSGETQLAPAPPPAPRLRGRTEPRVR